MRKSSSLALLWCVFLAFSTSALARQSSPPSQPAGSTVIRATMDPQSANLVPKALAALNGSSAVADITLTGKATRTVGPDTDTGTIVMKAMGAWDGRVDFTAARGTWTEVTCPQIPHGLDYDIRVDG